MDRLVMSLVSNNPEPSGPECLEALGAVNRMWTSESSSTPLSKSQTSVRTGWRCLSQGGGLGVLI